MPDRATRYRLVCCAALLSLQSFSWCSAEPASSPPEMLEDAELTDIFFLNPDRGWAVGDRGVILLTEDGGRRWTQADCPVNCRLESVYFVDDQHGWAVGGWSHPYSHKSTGVVLRTENGGQRWSRVPAKTLPALKQVHFIDPDHGWAIGNSSSMYPAGVFHSEDGGRGWTVLPHGSTNGWIAGQFPSHEQAVVLGRNGEVSIQSAGMQSRLRIPATGLRRTRDLCIAPPENGWIVGDGGLLLATSDRGQHWHASEGLPSVARELDFRSIAQFGSHLWIAGRPGSVVLRSIDAGRSWELCPTGEPTSLNRLCFLDAERGWAVGSLGTILATQDGGRSWHRQYGRRRVALLGLLSEASSLPIELVTRVSGDDGYLSAMELLVRRDVEVAETTESAMEDRVHEAMVRAGGAAAAMAWQFPARQDGLRLPADAVVAGWSSVQQADGLDKLQEYMVKRIRQWRPDVIVTEPPSPDGADPIGHLVNQVTLSAMELAAQPDSYPAHLRQLRLQPWRAKKLLSVAPDPRTGTLTIQTTELATRLGASLAEYAANSRGLLRAEWELPPSTIGFRLLVTHLPRDLAERDFFSGIGLSPGQDARRRLSQPAGNLRSLTKSAQKQRNIQQLLARAGEQQLDGRAWLAQVEDLTRGLSDAAAANVLYQLAQSYRSMGRYSLTAETLLLLVRRQPDHPMTEPALLWLIRFASSSEVKWGLGRRDPQLTAPADFAAAATVVAPAGYVSGESVDPVNPVRNAVGGLGSESEVIDRTLKLGDFIQRTRPPLFAEPVVRFAVAAAQRGQAASRATPQPWRQLVGSSLGEGWAQSARGELWLNERRGQSPKPVLVCQLADAKPQLDGRLDEPFWQASEPALLSSPLQDDQQWPGSVRLAHDDQHLYLGIECRKAAQADYPPSDQVRSRDPDLQSRDRVDVLIDVDRDYSTYFRLSVDYRGWVAESCFGDSRWDPEWYVAARANHESWTVEAAIPLEELTPPASGDPTWALGIQRVVPGVGFQSWTRPAAVQVRPEGFGYLRFARVPSTGRGAGSERASE